MIKEKKSLKITSIITISILITISLYIRLTEFLKADIFELILDKDRKILEKLVIVEKFYIKLIFGRYIVLD